MHDLGNEPPDECLPTSSDVDDVATEEVSWKTHVWQCKRCMHSIEFYACDGFVSSCDFCHECSCILTPVVVASATNYQILDWAVQVIMGEISSIIGAQTDRGASRLRRWRLKAMSRAGLTTVAKICETPASD